MTFSDVYLAFELRPETPDFILAAFSAAASTLPADAFQGPSPELPTPNAEPIDGWAPDWGTPYAPVDPIADEPWRHEWVTYLGNAMSVAYPSFIRLDWTQARRWAVTCRFSYKAWPPVIVEFLQWIAPYAAPQLPYLRPGEAEPPTLVGIMNWDAEPRPYLVWLEHLRLRLEDLN